MAERVFGEVLSSGGEVIPVGQTFADRRAVAAAGIHRPLEAGISGSESEGADSIVVSGGYEDDQDLEEIIVYTGQGGQDRVTKAQVQDQTFTRGNRALVVSQNEGLPVRVVRGANKASKFAPPTGYRYDGLFRVEESWQERGKAGFLMCRFRLVRWGQPSVDEKRQGSMGLSLPSGSASPGTRSSTVQRVIRNTAVGTSIKKLYDFRCQVCGVRLESALGAYAEAAHVRGLGAPHNGPDVPANVICLCPNHHALFDLGAFYINDDLSIGGLLKGRIELDKRHHLDRAHARYHRERFSPLAATPPTEGDEGSGSGDEK